MIRAEAAAAAEGGSRESGDGTICGQVQCYLVYRVPVISCHRHLFMWMYTLYSESNTLYYNTTHLVLEIFSCLII